MPWPITGEHFAKVWNERGFDTFETFRRFSADVAATREKLMALVTRLRGEGKRIAGVCAGLSAYTGIDVTLIRVAFVIFAFTGIGKFVYLLLWIFAPKEAKK